MSGTYKMIDLVGTSDQSFTQAVKNAVAEASRTLTGLSWFEVVESRGRIKEGGITEFQVTVRLAFKILRGESSGGNGKSVAASVAAPMAGAAGRKKK
jgi:flavin-binding protein dodecin